MTNHVAHRALAMMDQERQMAGVTKSAFESLLGGTVERIEAKDNESERRVAKQRNRSRERALCLYFNRRKRAAHVGVGYGKIGPDPK
jgi:hypothetical protein